MWMMLNRGVNGSSRPDQSSPSSPACSSSSHSSHRVTMETPLAHTVIVIARKKPAPTIAVPHHRHSLYFQHRCLFTLHVQYVWSVSPSGSQSFFSARHIGALIRKFLPLERTVVALVKAEEQRNLQGKRFWIKIAIAV